jgi:hypothetical protein
MASRIERLDVCHVDDPATTLRPPLTCTSGLCFSLAQKKKERNMGWAGLPENKGRPSPFGGCGLLRFPAALWAQRQTAGTAGLNALPGSQSGSGSASAFGLVRPHL